MAVLQCSYYFCLGMVLLALHALFGTPLSMSHIFSANHMSMESAPGWCDIIAHLIASVLG